jgi:hypothetical protein
MLTPRIKGISSQVCLVRVRIGASQNVVKMSVLGANASARSGLRKISDDAAISLAKKSDAVDTLVASKLGYKPTKKAVTSYTASNVLVIINKIPVAIELGIISERAPSQLNYANVNIYGWDQGVQGDTSSHGSQLSLAYTGDKEEGTKCCRVVIGNIGWHGWGIAPKDTAGADMSGYIGGKLHFYIKGTAPSLTAFVTWNVKDAASKIDLATKGYVAGDDTWHLIEIPLSEFGDVVYTNITYYVCFGAPASGGTYTPFTYYMVDDVTWVPAAK